MLAKTAIVGIFIGFYGMGTRFVNDVEAQPHVVINEIMYAPKSPEPEWVELFNADSNNIDLTNWQISAGSKSATLPAVILPAGGYLVLTKDSAALIAKRPGSYSISQILLPTLSNAGDAMVLKNAALQTIDSLYYMPSWGGSSGTSLERRNYKKSATDPSNWGSSMAPTGATPAARNSIATEAYNLTLDSLSYFFSSDTLSITVQIVNRGMYAINTSTLTMFADTGSGPTSLSTIAIGPLLSDSSLYEHIMLPHVSERASNYSVNITSATDTIHSDDTVRFQIPTGARPLAIVMNEIMFAPVKPEPEWIELWNASQDPIDIGGWNIVIGHNSARAIPFANSLIPPDSLIVLTASDSALAAFHHISTQRIVSVSLPTLSNSGSTLALFDARGNLIDSVNYNGSWIPANGISIERIDPSQVGYLPTNWKACEDSSGSTILRPNSVRIRDYDLALTSAVPSDSAIELTLVNMGKDTVRHTMLALLLGTFNAISEPISIVLPSHDSLGVSVALPQNFFGLFQATAYLVDSLDKQHSNDTLHLNIARPIPPDSLVINEIMFTPQPGGCEWLEVDNLSSRWVSLDSTRLITGEKSPNKYKHEIPVLFIPPDSFGLVTANDTLFDQSYPRLEGSGGIVGLNTSSLDLGRDSCFVVLQNEDSTTIDSVHYFKTWQQSLLTKTFVGISLERKDPRGASNDPQNWHASLDSATPLAKNSVDTSTTITTLPAGPVFAASFSPNPFSPDGDGFQDQSTLTVQTGDDAQWALRVRLYDARGRMVRMLTDATSIFRSLALTFDGKRDNSQTLPPGLYTTLIELTSQSPLRTLKQTVGVVIAGKRR